MKSKIELKEIDSDNWRENLHVKDEQKEYVSDLKGIEARAYAFRSFRSHALMIYYNDTAVGAALYYDYEPYKAYDFCELFIDERYQGKGYGKQACKLIFDRMKADGKYKKVILCYIDGNTTAEKMYLELGFTKTGEEDEDEILMSMDL